MKKFIKQIKRVVKWYCNLNYDFMRCTGDSWIRPALN